MAADRGAFIDQSMSLNIHIADPSYGKLTSMHFYGWKKGLKTGMYYLRTRPAVDAIKFTVDQTSLAASIKNQAKIEEDENQELEDSILVAMTKVLPQCAIDNEGCIACSG